MKKILSLLFLIIIFPNHLYALKLEQKFIDLWNYDVYKELGIFPYMNDKLRIWDIEFPKSITSIKQNHFVNLCERVTKWESIDIYCKNWEEQSYKIPKDSEIIEFFKDKIWEQKFNNLIQRDKNNKTEKIQLYWYNYPQENTDVWQTQVYKVNSPQADVISIKIYPITSNKYFFDNYSQAELDKEWFKKAYPYFTIFPASFDYYGISVENYSINDSSIKQYPNSKNIDPLTIFPTEGTFIEKKFILTTFKWNSIFSGNIFYKRTIVPYYEYSIPVIKWDNIIKINYQTSSLRWNSQYIDIDI